MVINDRFHKKNVRETLNVQVVKADNSVLDGKSEVTVEHFMEIYLNDRLILKLVCTPENLLELAAGRLVSEGFVKEIQDVESIDICESGQRVRVYLTRETALTESVKAEPTCCTANRQFYRPAEENMDTLPKVFYRPEWIFELAKAFAGGSSIHKKTKGAHSCFLMYNGKIVYSAEDIGRHNALDKAVGFAFLNGYEREHCILFTSGRVPVDMAQKVIQAGIPVLVSKAVPTDAAVCLAEKYNLTLICKAWQDSYEVFYEAKERAE
ncbi:MAG: formate dehydrogenase accessory sulfurtransferase FdhD [Alistipes sp.]|nr:formate dehydrogenase accessory sulfurtransferase FdhD [Alistipes sp.]